MAQQWQGQSYNEKWEPTDPQGNVTGARDDAAFKSATGGGRFDWGGWNPTGASSSSSGGSGGGTSPWAAPTVESQPWGGAANVQGQQVAQAPPLSGFGSDVQGSIQRDLGPARVDTSDPAYTAQVDAFRRNEQRSADRLRAGAAQRANATGTLNSGGFDTQVNRVLQNQGARESDFEAQLMGSELAAARDRTARAQQLGTGLLSQEQSQSLQQRLADQQAAQQAGLANQGVQQQTGLANQDANMRAQLANQQAALAGRSQNWQETQGGNDAILRRNALNLQSQLGLGDLGLRARGLGQQDEQYYAGLGQQLGLSQAQLNQQAMMSLLS